MKIANYYISLKNYLSAAELQSESTLICVEIYSWVPILKTPRALQVAYQWVYI